MDQNNQPQGTIEAEKPEIASTDRPAKDGDAKTDRSEQNSLPRTEVDADQGAPQPMAHLPEGSAVTENTQRRPAQKSN